MMSVIPALSAKVCGGVAGGKECKPGCTGFRMIAGGEQQRDRNYAKDQPIHSHSNNIRELT
jgi:hypothetical protein